MNPVVTSHVLVFNEKGEALLVKHTEASGHINGVYGIPGGGLATCEQLIDAAVRELREETGLSVSKKDLHTYPDNHYAARIKRKDGKVHDSRMYVYVATKYKGELQSCPETEPAWIEVKEIYSLPLLPNVAKAVMASVDKFKLAR